MYGHPRRVQETTHTFQFVSNVTENVKKLAILKKKARIVLIKRHYPTLNFQEIAVMCGCTRMTIYRDFSSWIRSNDYEIWLHQRHMELLSEVAASDPVNALKVINRLLAELRGKRQAPPAATSFQVKMMQLNEPANH